MEDEMEDMRGPAHRRPAAKRRSGRMMLFTCTALGAIHAGTCLPLDFAVQQGGGKSRALGFASRGTAFQQLAGVGGCAEGSNQRYGMGGLSSQRGICHGRGHASIRGARRGRVDSGLVRMQQMPGLGASGQAVGTGGVQETTSTPRGEWLNRAPGVLDGRLRTDDGWLVSDLQNINQANFIDDLLTTFSSNITKRIIGRLTATCAWAAYVTAIVLYGDILDPDNLGVYTNFEAPNWPHELVGGFLAILIVFRTNQAYERFWMGRQLWASLISYTRKLTTLTLTHMPASQSTEVMAHIAAFPWALKMHLRGYKNEAELRMIYMSFLGEAGAELSATMAKSNNMPMTIVTMLSHLMVPLRGLDRSARYESVWQMAEWNLDGLSQVVSGCEKIKCTPLPLSYSRHTSRFFSLFCFSLPFVLVKQTSPLIVPIIVLLVSWVLYATNEVGHLIEDPFGSNTTVQRPVRSSGATRQPPKDAVGLEEEIGYSVQEEKVIVDMFKRLDKDKKGNVTIAELEEGLPAIFADMGLPTSKIQEMIGGLDVDGDGLVLVEEFLSTWTLMFGSGGMRQLEALPLSAYCDMVLRDSLYYWNVCSSKAFTPMQLEQSMLQIAGTKAFETIDRDGSGRITQEELRDAMPPWCSDEDLVREFKKMDVDGDGSVSKEEMKKAWAQSSASNWLRARGFGDYCAVFDSKDISIDILVRLTGADLAALGVSSLGVRVEILEQIEILRQQMGLD